MGYLQVTTEKSVPRECFQSSLDDLKILCLASGGDKQETQFYLAAGADVTVT